MELTGCVGIWQYEEVRTMGERAKKMCSEARFGWRKSKVLEKKMGFSFQFGREKTTESEVLDVFLVWVI